MDTVLVTGGAGYVGSHTCKGLRARGFEPVVYDDLCRGQAAAVRWGPLEKGCVTDRDALRTVLERHRPVGVFHFAGLADVAESMSDPAAYYRTNVGGMMALLDAVRGTGVRNLIFSSSCAVYGHPTTLPISEDQPRTPISPYGAGKLMAERLLEDYAGAYGIATVALRYFNAAGADPDGEIGEDHDPESHVVPSILRVACGTDPPPFRIFGDDFPSGDGTAVRDFVHVTDLAEAHGLALDHLLGGGPSLVANLGTGRGHSVRELIAAAERITGHSIPVVSAPRRVGDPAELIAEATRARQVLGWEPTFSDLDTIIGTTWQWLRSRRRG